MEQKFVGFKCKSCGRVMMPKHDRCLGCRGTEFEEVELQKEGILITYTKLYALPEGIDMPPLTIGIADFEGVRVLGQVTTDNPKIGMKLRPIWGKLRKLRGVDVFGFKFEPVK